MKLHERTHADISLNFRNIQLYCCPTNISKLGTFYDSWLRCILALRIVHTRSPCRNYIADYNINIVSHIYIRRSERLRIVYRYLVYSVSAVIIAVTSVVATAVVLFIVVVVIVVASVSHLYFASRRGIRVRKSRQVR